MKYVADIKQRKKKTRSKDISLSEEMLRKDVYFHPHLVL